MKVYRVVRGKGEWQALLPDSHAPIVASDNREVVVRWACEVAKKEGGEVHVHDYTGKKVQVICTYEDGIERRAVVRSSESPPVLSHPRTSREGHH
jgi:hypothetical protein